MGIDLHGLAAVRMAADRQPLGNTLTLGRQELHGITDEIGKAFGPSGYAAASEAYCEKLLITCLGASSVDSLDMSSYEGATYSHDLNLPVPKKLHSKYDTILDFGTLEHVFDVRQALENVSDLCRLGGQIVHVVPADNFCGHGFWQFSPSLFSSLYRPENGFSETEIYLADISNRAAWFSVLPLNEGERLRLQTSSPTYVIVRTVKASREVRSLVVNQEDYVLAWGKRIELGSIPPTKSVIGLSVAKLVSRVLDALRRVWILEMALIAPLRFFANRSSSLSRWNQQLKPVPTNVDIGPNQNEKHRF